MSLKLSAALALSARMPPHEVRYAAAHGVLLGTGLRQGRRQAASSTLRIACRARLEEPVLWHELLEIAAAFPPLVVPDRSERLRPRNDAVAAYFTDWASPSAVAAEHGLAVEEVFLALRGVARHRAVERRKAGRRVLVRIAPEGRAA